MASREGVLLTPDEIYRVAKARGMDLVCITDHDSMSGCLEFLDRHPDAPDFITGEEISCLVPDAPGLRVHLGAIGMTEALHDEVQRLRDNVFHTAKYLREQGVFFAFNHLFMLFDDQMAVESYVRQALTLAPGFETETARCSPNTTSSSRNSPRPCDRPDCRPVAIGGSDAHILRYVGTTYTEAAGRTREEFLANLVEGRTEVGGDHGGRQRLLAEIYGLIVNHWGGILGFKRHEITVPERLSSIVCSALLLPFQFIPGVIAFRMKQKESDRVERYRRMWAEDAQGGRS